MTKPEFSKREQEVIECLLKGKSNKEIAQIMDVSVRTVEFHLSNIYSRLNVHSRTEAVIKLTEAGPERPAGKNTSGILRESTVAEDDGRAENEGNQTQRRFPMKEILTALVVLVSSVITIYKGTSVVVGIPTPNPTAYEMEETMPPTPTPYEKEETMPPTPTPYEWEEIMPPTPTPGMKETPTPLPLPVRRKKTPTPLPLPVAVEETATPLPLPVEMEETATPLPLPVEMEETATPLPLP